MPNIFLFGFEFRYMFAMIIIGMTNQNEFIKLHILFVFFFVKRQTFVQKIICIEFLCITCLCHCIVGSSHNWNYMYIIK